MEEHRWPWVVGRRMNTTMGGEQGSHWLQSTRTFLAMSAVGHLMWEILQLPLYVIWTTETGREITFAIIHCVVGDLIVATLSLVAALLLFGSPAWPSQWLMPTMVATLVMGMGYAVYSEWVNTVFRKAWAYAELMPVVPLLGTGVSPLMQWFVVPTMAFAAIWFRHSRMNF